MRLSRASGDPYYQQIKDALRTRILTGQLKPGAAIPDERTLAGSLKVSRKTTRRAILELTAEGLLRRIRGRGTYVRESLNPQSAQRECVLIVSPYSPFTFRYYGEILEGVYRAASAANLLFAFEYVKEPYDVLLASIRRHQSLKGILAVGVADEALLQQMLRLNVPLVLVDGQEPTDRPLFDMVTHDAQPGVYAAVQYLQQLGHKQIAFLGSENMKGNIGRRLDGYVRAMSDAGQPPKPEQILSTGFYPEAAYATTRRLLSQPNVPTALVCVSDDLAAGAMAAVKDCGWRVPQDMSIVGFGELGLFTSPRLATVRVAKAELGASAMRLLQLRLAQPTAPLQHLALAVEFLAHNSCDVPRTATRKPSG